jgi:hypothetical protein
MFLNVNLIGSSEVGPATPNAAKRLFARALSFFNLSFRLRAQRPILTANSLRLAA